MNNTLLSFNRNLLNLIHSGNDQSYILIKQIDGTITELSISTVECLDIMTKDMTLEDNHEYIDLGLPSGTLWATCNVGANKPDENGVRFAWGETIPKDEYEWNNYKYCHGDENTLTKYCSIKEMGTVDNLMILEAADDAATANWGDAWRTPSQEEMSELCNKCRWEWVKVDHKFGFKVSSKEDGNNNYIFIPSIGIRTFMRGGYSFARYDCGEFWTSTLYGGKRSHEAWSYHFYEDGSSVGMHNRFEGRFVRPVRSTKAH